MKSSNPLAARAAALRLDHETLAAQSGLTVRSIYNVLHATGPTSLSVASAERLSRPLKVNFLTLLTGHALWRQATGHRLIDNESAWVRSAETVTRHRADVLATLSLSDLDDALNRPPSPPKILTKEVRK